MNIVRDAIASGGSLAKDAGYRHGWSIPRGPTPASTEARDSSVDVNLECYARARSRER